MERHTILGELVSFKNAKEFHHDGILYQDASFRTTIIHVHGSFGNFYQNEFLRIMAKAYMGAKINFLSFNLAGHDAVAEGYRYEWDFEYVGGAIVDFEECLFDIQAAVDFVKPFSDRIILQGHSLGCDRVLHFVLTTQANHDVILLSPCDSYQLQANWIAPETVEQQIERLKCGQPVEGTLDWLPTSEYGIRQGDWDYPIHINRRSLLSIMQGSAFRLIRIDRPTDFYINQKSLIYIGGDDTLQTAPRDVMFNYFEERVREVTRVSLYPDGDHSLWGCERQVGYEIVNWVWSLDSATNQGHMQKSEERQS